MARKPQPGGDRNAWGAILNEYFDVAHNTDGTIKPAGVQTAVATEVETALSVQLPPAVVDAVAADSTVTAAAAAAIDAEPRVSALTTSMAVVEPSVQLANTRTYDTRAYASVQAAIDAASSDGGGTVFVGEAPPSGLDIVLADKVYLTGRGIGATTWNVRSIRGTGSVAALPALGATAVRDARSVTFTTPHGLAAGDIFIISNPTDSTFNAARTYYRAGEFCRVKSVSGNTVNLTHPLYGAPYTAASVNLYKLNPIRTGVSNMTLNCQSGLDAIKVTYGSDLEFANLKMSGTDFAHINLSRCYSVNIRAVSAFDAQAEVGYNYGICLMNSQRIRVSDCELETSRHGFVTGGEGVAGTLCTVPNRDIVVSDSFINGLSSTSNVSGCNLHGNSEWVRFENCTFPSGVNPSGDNVTYRNCDISTPPYGSAIRTMETLGVNFTVENCRINATDNHSNDYGLIHFLFLPTATRQYGTFTFRNNVINLNNKLSDGALTQCLFLYTQSAVGSTSRYAHINSNVFEFQGSTLTDKVALRVVVESGGDTWQTIDYVGNGGRLAPQLSVTSAGTLVFFDGWGLDAPAFTAARGSRYMRRTTGGTDTGLLYVNQSGSTTWTAK